MALLGPTDRFIQAALNATRGVNFTAFTAQVGFMLTAMTTSDGAGATELVHADYSRKAAGFGAAAGTSRQVTNAGLITFTGGSSGPWNSGLPIQFFGIWDGSGNLWWVDEIVPAFLVGGSGVPVTIPINSLILRGNTRTI